MPQKENDIGCYFKETNNSSVESVLERDKEDVED